ncbi:OLC1v1037905C1 [Oldenlandia corymbosa var. corymbosa]|uniref:Copper transport protein n=1 Tax=Oldenlandia corymbosa var. corymbosa TaxID=529605 RepID=A0AAV1CZG8_OLDCO|nr:OLC1v1037905C1 [Oldenlandia corymbosa var. corymbosa]
MTLYWGKEVTLLFDSWKTDSWLTYSLTLLFCFFLSFFYQHLEARRLNFKLRSTLRPPSSSSSSSSDGIRNSVSIPIISSPPKSGPKKLWVRVASSLLFGVNSAIGYFIMLTIMTYNGGVFVAVILGLSVGYFLFRSGDFGDGEDAIVAVESNNNACGCS